jgi:hypothetical protein
VTRSSSAESLADRMLAYFQEMFEPGWYLVCVGAAWNREPFSRP